MPRSSRAMPPRATPRASSPVAGSWPVEVAAGVVVDVDWPAVEDFGVVDVEGPFGGWLSLGGVVGVWAALLVFEPPEPNGSVYWSSPALWASAAAGAAPRA